MAYCAAWDTKPRGYSAVRDATGVCSFRAALWFEWLAGSDGTSNSASAKTFSIASTESGHGHVLGMHATRLSNNDGVRLASRQADSAGAAKETCFRRLMRIGQRRRFLIAHRARIIVLLRQQVSYPLRGSYRRTCPNLRKVTV